MALRTAYDDASDADLVAAVIAREPAAWPTFFAKYERLVLACVRRTLRRYGASHAEEDIEDLASQTAFNLVKDDYKKLRTFDATRGYKLSSWVGLIATNTALDSLRRRAPTDVWSASSLDDTDPLAHTLPSEAADPDEELSRKERIDQAEAAVAGLSTSDRLFLEYYYVDDREPEEIARLMSISLNTVYSRKNKIRQKLAALVGGEAGGDRGDEEPTDTRKKPAGRA